MGVFEKDIEDLDLRHSLIELVKVNKILIYEITILLTI